MDKELIVNDGLIVDAKLILNEDGSVFVEYIVLAGLFSLVVAGAVLALGDPLLSFYRHTQLVWGGSFP